MPVVPKLAIAFEGDSLVFFGSFRIEQKPVLFIWVMQFLVEFHQNEVFSILKKGKKSCRRMDRTNPQQKESTPSTHVEADSTTATEEAVVATGNVSTQVEEVDETTRVPQSPSLSSPWRVNSCHMDVVFNNICNAYLSSLPRGHTHQEVDELVDVYYSP